MLTGDGLRTYPASMQPVSFPTQAVQEAADQCRSAAGKINDKMNAAATAASEATVRWKGGHADDFNITWPDTEMSAGDLETRLLSLASSLEDAIAEVAAENLRRENLRSEHDWERTHPHGPI